MKKYQDFVYNELLESNIIITKEERKKIEIVDFGLGDFEKFGLGIVIYENNQYYCAKELVMFPNQICPEHRHPSINGKPGKQETLRVRKGVVEINYDLKPYCEKSIKKGNYNCTEKIILRAGQQITIPQNTRHWFKAIDEVAIISEFSLSNADEFDIFTDPKIKRVK